MTERVPRWWWLAVLVVAVAARLAVTWRLGAQLDLDRDLYLGIARHLAAGDGFMHPDSLQPTAYRPPLYPLLLVTAMPWGRTGIATLHLLLGVMTVALTMACGMRLRLGKWSAVAGLLTALDPLLLQGQIQIMTETLAAVLTAALLFVLIPEPARGAEPSSPLPRPWQSVVAGLLLGLCCLCRPTYWAFAVCWSALAVMSMIARWRMSRVDGALIENFGRRRALRWLLVSLAFGAIQLPWIVRNQLVFGTPILTTTHGGYTLLLGHNAEYYREVVQRPWGTVWSGESLSNWQQNLERELSQQSPPLDFRAGKVDEVARDRWMSRAAWRTIRLDPGWAVRAGGTLLGRFWSSMPQETESGVSRMARWSIALWYGALFIAAVAGLWSVCVAAEVHWWPVLTLIVSVTLVHTLYWADMRMRAPLSPALALLAVHWMSVRTSVASRKFQVSRVP